MAERPVSIFIAYAEADHQASEELQKHLVMFRRKRIISFFDQNRSVLGQDREREVLAGLAAADVVIMLLSPDFVASDECYMIQEKALELAGQAGTKVIPILYKECQWNELEEVHRMQPLPRNKTFIEHWPSTSQAFTEISQEIGTLAKAIQPNLKARPEVAPATPNVLSEAVAATKPAYETDDLLKLYSKARSEEALDLIIERTKDDDVLYPQAVFLKAQWTRLQNDISDGTITFENSNVQSNKINQAILKFILGMKK